MSSATEPCFPARWRLAMLCAVGAWCLAYLPVCAALVVAERVRR